MHLAIRLILNRPISCIMYAASSRIVKPKRPSLPSFNSFDLPESICEYLKQKQFHTPSSIQQKAYSLMLQHKSQHNYYLVAPTGSGKTLAYLLPIFIGLKEQQEKAGTRLTDANRPRCLIIVSSKQLVTQVTQVCKGLSHFCKLKAIGLNRQLSGYKQKQLLASGADIVVTTLDRFAKQRDYLYLSQLSYLVIDQLDTLIDSNTEAQLSELIEAVKIRQVKAKDKGFFIPKITLVSATYTKPIDRFFQSCFKYYERDPRFYSKEEWQNIYSKEKTQNYELRKIVDNNTNLSLQNIRHEFIHSKGLDKHQPLYTLIAQLRKSPVLVFCNTVKSLQQLQYYLQERGIQTVSLHGNLPRQTRYSNLSKFNGRAVNILLSTDLGSRGLDFPFLEHVVNYDFPNTTSDYIHRAGRTGRAGRQGTVHTLYHSKNLKMINQLKQSHQTKTPLDVRNSAYSLRNRQTMTGQKRKVVKMATKPKRVVKPAGKKRIGVATTRRFKFAQQIRKRQTRKNRKRE